jgi:hypothetical protein
VNVDGDGDGNDHVRHRGFSSLGDGPELEVSAAPM